MPCARRAVAGRDRQRRVDHVADETGTAQHRARAARIDHRMHARGRAVGLGSQHRGPQGGEAARRVKDGDGDAIGLQCTAHVNQRSGQIVDGVEQTEADHQIVGSAGQGRFFVDGVRRRMSDRSGRQVLVQSVVNIAHHQCGIGGETHEGETVRNLLHHRILDESGRVAFLLKRAHTLPPPGTAGLGEYPGYLRGAHRQTGGAPCRDLQPSGSRGWR